MKKILITTPDPNAIGGISTYFNALKEHLSEGVEFFTIGARQGESGLGSAIARVCSDAILFYRKLHLTKFDIVHLNPSLLPKAFFRDGLLHRIAKARGVKTVVFFHGWDKDFELDVEKRFLPLFKWMYGDADIIVVLASDFATWLSTHGFKTRVVRETTVVEDAVFAEIPDENKFSQRLDRTIFNILYLSRLDRGKGLFEALAAYQLLKDKYPNITLTIAGDGPEMASAKLAVQGDSSVNFLGFVRGKKKFNAFLDADVFLFPSYGEGFPISVLEAMAFGLPVVTRNVGGIKDFFENGKMGMVTDSLAPQTFADYIESVYNSPDRGISVGKYNQAFSRSNFSAAEISKRLGAIYSEIL